MYQIEFNNKLLMSHAELNFRTDKNLNTSPENYCVNSRKSKKFIENSSYRWHVTFKRLWIYILRVDGGCISVHHCFMVSHEDCLLSSRDYYRNHHQYSYCHFYLWSIYFSFIAAYIGEQDSCQRRSCVCNKHFIIGQMITSGSSKSLLAS